VYRGLPKSELVRRLGQPAAYAGIAIMIVSGPMRAPSSASGPAVPKPSDPVKASAQTLKKREENLEALEGDPDELRSSGEPDAYLPYQFVDPSSVEENPESVHLPDYTAPESEGAHIDDQDGKQAAHDGLSTPAGDTEATTASPSAEDTAADGPQATADPGERSAESRGESTGEHRGEAEELHSVEHTGEALRERWREREVQRARWRAPDAEAVGAAEPQPELPRAPIAASPVATEPRLAPRMPRKPDVAPAAPRKLGVMPGGPPKRSVVPVPVRLLAPKPEVASTAVPLVVPKTEVVSAKAPLVAPKAEAASRPESAPEPDPAPKRAYRPWLADAAESGPIEQEPER
jgi:hypothetical protein